MSAGKATQTSMAHRVPFLLRKAKPLIHQTPGRVQYYKAENEPFLPGKNFFGFFIHF
jgi:hypothetical protein